MRSLSKLLFTAVAISVASLAGCSSDGSNPSATGGASGLGGAGNSGGATGGMGTLTGTVSVELFGDQDYSTVVAKIFDGPQAVANPSLGPLEVSQEQSGCQLKVPKVVACNPTCGAAGVCTDENHCTPHPAAVNVGTLRVQGLGMDLNLDPISFGYSGPTLPLPPCAEGADVKAQADPFTVATKCIAPLALSGPNPIPVMAGQPTALTWVPPGQAGISRVQIVLEISHHGGYKGEIDCDVPDTGSFEIPATLVTALVNLGRAGYPTVGVTRHSTVAASAMPGVKLRVLSYVERPVDTGVISCGIGESMCPDGTTCDIVAKICN